LIRVDSDVSVPGGMSNTAASMLGFFSMRMAIDSVFGTRLVIPIGTTAPFSAISGVEKNTTSWLGTGAWPPSAFSVSSMECVSNAALFQASAAATPGFNHPAAATSVMSVKALPAFSACLRSVFIEALSGCARNPAYCKRRAQSCWSGPATSIKYAVCRRAERRQRIPRRVIVWPARTAA
jgi:hypothetical protein